MTTAVALLPEKRKMLEPKRYTLEEYLAREEKSKYKHEYCNGEIKRMAGGTSNHSEISINIGFAIKNAIKNAKKNLRVFDSNLGIYISEMDAVFYADILVVFEKLEYKFGSKSLLINPILIVEVASKSTRNFDREEKFEAYKTLPSFKEYILIEQTKPQIESRLITDSNRWETEIVNDLSKTITLRSLGIEILLSDIYENIEF